MGEIADPRDLGDHPKVELPEREIVNDRMLIIPPEDGSSVEVQRGPNIVPLRELEPLPEEMNLDVLLKTEDNVSTDSILPAGNKVLPFRSNIPAIAEFAFSRIDKTFASRAKQDRFGMVVGGENYGQGSSREHAALAPRHLGLRVVLVKSFARIHRSNLINFGVLPLVFDNPADYEALEQGDRIELKDIHEQLKAGNNVEMIVQSKNTTITASHNMSPREMEILRAGGMINLVRQNQ
jgi:aconitate hydratase